MKNTRPQPTRLKAALVILLCISTGSPGLLAQEPAGGTVRAGDARISGEGTSTTRIDQTSERAIIDWRSFGIGAADEVIFQQPSAQSATLNRVTGEQVSVILGKLDANGTVLLINPNGIVFGGGAQVNVGSLIASTSSISDANFMSGALVFDRPGRPGAGILNGGSLTARDGGLVALVAPHVRNDGVIVARLGRVALGAADTFTVDLYGDALINLALSDSHAGQLMGLNGEPVTSLITNAGRIETAGGQTVLMTARTARNVLDNLINMTGTIKADSAVQQGGHILLLGEGGRVDVNGSLSAQGSTGGSIQVLGERVHLGSEASLDASGLAGGGRVQVGGAYQGTGDTYRSVLTTVEAGAAARANAIARGDGGEVVVWSDGHSEFAGLVEAKGGTERGNGGRLEVSGKHTLDFTGQADASAAAGNGGTLLLDPEYLNIGTNEAGALMRVMRTGTTANLQADVDINVDAPILGGDRSAGGGLNMTAGHSINVNDFIVTHDGAINLNATQGAVNVAPGIAVFAGSAPITVTAGGDVQTGSMLTSGSLSIRSIAGTVNISQPIVNMASGSTLTVTAGTDINVNAQVDGRGGVEGGAVAMTATRDLNVNQAIVTNNGDVSLAATNGAIHMDAPLVSGTGAMTLDAHGSIVTGPLSAGSLTVNSSAGSVGINGIIDSVTRDVRISAATDVTITEAILNGQSGGSLTVTAGRDVNVGAVVDGRGGIAGGVVTLNATRNLNVSDYVLTQEGAINFSAANGTVVAGKGALSGGAAIVMRAAGDLTTGVVSGGSLSASSTGGSVRVNGVIEGTTGHVDLTAGQNVAINNSVVTNNAAIGITAAGTATMAPGTALVSGNAPIAITAGGDIRTQGISGGSLSATSTGGSVSVDGLIDGNMGRVDLAAARDVNVNTPVNTQTGASFNATAGSNINVNASIATRNGGIHLSATNGAATVAPAAGLYAGGAAISLQALGNVSTGTLSGGTMNIVSRGGSVLVGGQISGNGSAVALSAGQNVQLNDSIVTQGGAISVTAGSGTVTVAAGEGLFAGAGAITVQSGQTLSTPAIVTTGSVTLRSTGGSVNVDRAIGGTTGAVTIQAANDVNLNSAIANPRTDAPLAVTAGRDINVNVTIDGRDGTSLTRSGGVTLNAQNNIALNQSVVSNDAAISLTAQDGAVTTAATKGLFAGSGAISVTSGATLNTPVTATTGALNLTSAGGAVNINQAIGDTTGNVAISAGTAVNVNQAITNLKTGSNLTIAAGTDINVLAAVDGRNGTTAGGTVTMTAGNDINVSNTIATNNGAIALTATAGSVTLPVGTEVIGPVLDVPTNTVFNEITTPMQASIVAGNAAVTMTSGGDFTLTSPVTTTGALTITSTNGDVTTAAPIRTGTVTLTAGDQLVVNREVRTNNQAIVLNAGAGGILINQIDDKDYTGTSSVNSGTANLTMNSVGNVTILDNTGVATTGTLTIDTRGQIIDGNVGDALAVGSGRPQAIVLNADAGIAFFKTGEAGSVTAASSGGSINLNVSAPGQLRVTTGTPGTTDCPACDIAITSGRFDHSIGPDVVLNAGGSINMSLFRTATADFTARSGDINLGDYSVATDSFTGAAGRDIHINNTLWMGADPNNIGGGPLTLTAGRDIVEGVTAAIHVSNSQAATFLANRHLTLFKLETLGAVSLTATTGNITLNNDIGGHVINGTGYPDFNPLDLGVASLNVFAPAATAAINMQGARAQGNVTISTGGTLVASKQITSIFGTVSIFAAGGATLSALPIGNVAQVDYPTGATPVTPPGPSAPVPSSPGLTSNGAAGLPAFAQIPEAAGDQIADCVIPPAGSVAVPSTGGAPNRTSGINGRPGSPSGSVEPPAGDSPDSDATEEAVRALRTAGQACGEESASAAETGLDAAVPKNGSADATGQRSASCAATP